MIKHVAHVADKDILQQRVWFLASRILIYCHMSSGILVFLQCQHTYIYNDNILSCAKGKIKGNECTKLGN